MEVQHLYHDSCLVPFVGTGSCLVLNVYMSAHCHWRERLRVFSPASVRKGVFVAEGSLPDVKILFPHGVEVKFAR